MGKQAGDLRHPTRDPAYVRDAFARIARRYVTANHVLSLGIDILWRRKVARIVASWKPDRVLDVASGTGDLALEISRRCPEAEITASDFCPEMLEIARERGLENTVVADAMDMPFPDASFDALTVAFGLRNMADYPAALREMRRVLRPGGHLLILDFSLPSGPLRGPYRLYLHHFLPRIAGLVTGQRDAYQYLGGTIEDFPSGGTMCQLIESAGFHDAAARPLTFGVASIYTAENR
jgi:demethylmenaquinone methyltransferase/2-methoxy-6-polyprenyl-1,4-benzoquinol methylase